MLMNKIFYLVHVNRAFLHSLGADLFTGLVHEMRRLNREETEKSVINLRFDSND